MTMAILGVWMWPGSVREGGAKAAAARCKRTGVTEIYFLTKGMSGKATFSNHIAPVDCGRDLLGELLDIAHQHGIRVHAWYTSANDEFTRNNTHTAAGIIISREKGAEIFSDAYRARDKHIHALARARRKDMKHFATALTSADRTEKTGLILSAALMPEGAYDDIAFFDVHYGQNYEDAARLYDYTLPMAYSQAHGKDSAWTRDIAPGIMERGLKTIVGVHAFGEGPEKPCAMISPPQGEILWRAFASPAREPAPWPLRTALRSICIARWPQPPPASKSGAGMKV
jgi:hypothetical protein